MAKCRVKKKKIFFLSQMQYEAKYLNQKEMTQKTNWNKSESNRAVAVNVLSIIGTLIIAIPGAIFGSIWIGVIFGVLILPIQIYRLIKNNKIRKMYKDKDEATNKTIDFIKDSLLYKETTCPSCNKKVSLCKNAFMYECGKCKRTNDVVTVRNTEMVAGTMNIRKLFAKTNIKDRCEINKKIIDYLIDNKEYFKHRCKCRAINEFDTAKQLYVCPHCGTTNIVEGNVL